MTERSTKLARDDGEPTGEDLQIALEPAIARLTNRHLSVAKPWYPYEFIPWDEGRNFSRLGGEDWQDEQSKLTKVAQTAMRLNVLTEDNLPGYFAVIHSKSSLEAWQEWSNRWTAEEARHGYSMHAYLDATRGVDPKELEDARMVQMSAGYDAGNRKSFTDTLAYVSLQEAATAVSHANTGKAAGSGIAEQLMNRITIDERLHTAFYRGALAAALEVAPNQTMESIRKELTGFEMPGSRTIPGFGRAALIMAQGGIYNVPIHTDAIAGQTLKFLQLGRVEGLSDEGKRARDAIDAHVAELERKSKEYTEKEAARQARLNTSRVS